MTTMDRTSKRKPVFADALQIVRPTFPPLQSIEKNFADCLQQGQVTNNSKWVVEFERQLTSWLDVPTLVFSSGQAALMTMLRAAGIVSGEVIVPALTFSATPHAVVWAGAKPVFADICDDLSFCIDPEDIEKRITERTVAILGMCPYGIACDYDALQQLGKKRKLKVLLDSAAAFGTRVGGRLAGGFCDAQIFSFHATKAFNTMEGGALCSHDEALLENAKAIRNFGQANDNCNFAGINGKMMEICALIGIEQLKTFPSAINTRRNAASKIAQGLSVFTGLRVPFDPPGQEPVWLYLPVLVDPEKFGADRDEVATMLADENLHVRKYYSPACHQLSVYQQPFNPALPVSEHVAKNVIALPIYNDMTNGECEGIVEAFKRVAERAVRSTASE